jgi:zinc transporter ZupT
MHYLLAFSGSFLLSVTFLHLLPETFEELNSTAGIYLLIGFFLQLLIQRITHGMEHGHTHIHPHDHEHHITLLPLLTGLSIHAAMDGLPLGFHYRMHATEPSLYLAIAVHKLPEAMLIASLVSVVKTRRQAFVILAMFSAITPVTAIMAQFAGERYYAMSKAVSVLIPIVAGAFIHIATTIFFESGTRQHMLTWQKLAAMLAGVGMAFLTLSFE